MADPTFERVRDTWRGLGEEDPLWAVVSHAAKRGGKWDPEEFLRTGEEDVARYGGLIQRRASLPFPAAHVLDFGCGAGRLTLAWRRRARRVTGVDISRSMIDCAERLRRRLDEAGRSEGGAVEFLVNERSDLSCFGAGVFDLVVTHICLQHMPWALAAGYVREFGRVCQPGGVVAFQVPSRLRRSPSGAVLRQRLVDSLPFNLGAWYRRWRHGSAHVFEMHYTPPEEVICVAAAAGLSLLHQEPDGSSGPATEGFIYLFRRGAAGERE